MKSSVLCSYEAPARIQTEHRKQTGWATRGERYTDQGGREERKGRGQGGSKKKNKRSIVKPREESRGTELFKSILFL